MEGKMKMEQTNRTILFGEINPNKNDLLTFIRRNEKCNGLTDEEIAYIHEKLEVKSYQEFLQKFEPSVNMILDTEQGTVSFTHDSSENDGRRIRLDGEKSFLFHMERLMDAKKNKQYVLTCFQDMQKNFIPVDNVSEFINQRNIIFHETEKEYVNHELVKAEIEGLMKQAEDGVFLLNVFLQDVYNLMEYEPECNKRDKGIQADQDRMHIKVIRKAKKYKNICCTYENMQTRLYKELLGKCIEEAKAKRECKNISLFKACMLLPVMFAEGDFYHIQKQYETYLKLYIEIIKRFWIAAKPIMETILGIREFFEPYQNTDGMCPSLIISNFKISDLEQPKNKEILELYLKTVNTKNDYKNTIWYAIIPNVANQNKKREHVMRERFQATQEQYGYERNEVEGVILLLESLAKYRIQSFFSMCLTQEHTFAAFAKYGVDIIDDSLRPFEKIEGKDYCIPCFPNFILIPKEEACLPVGKALKYNDLSEKIEIVGENLLWLDEIGIEASFVAAGLVAACQCPKYLKKYFGVNVDENLPGVAYRFSEQEHYLKTASGILSETIERTEEMERELIRGSRGILFSQKEGKMVVLTDRVLSYCSSNKLLISMVQTTNYIERRIQYETQDFKKNRIHQFFQRKPGSIISQWYATAKGVVNPVLREDEKLEYKMDEADESCTFQVQFKNSELVRSKTVSTFKE